MTDHRTPVDRAGLIALVERLAEANVLCVGDVMLDRFVYGEVERISPEAPIPVLRVEGETNMLGGAGNVVRNIAALGGAATLVAAVGADQAGASVKALLADQVTAKADLVTVTRRETAIKTRYLAGTQQLMRADRETPGPVTGAAARKIVAAAKRAMKACSAVVLSDYGKGVLCPDVISGVIEAAKKAGRPVIIDPKGRDYWRYQGADLITPNRRELGEAVGHPVETEADIVQAAERLIVDYDLGGVLVTRSQDGMTLVGADGRVDHLEAEAREVFDVSGAGDTVAAAIGAALSVGAGWAEAAALANVAAGIVVGKVGTAAAYAADVITALHHQDLSQAESKVLTLEQALDRLELWRRNGYHVGFTNGCFDLLHPGHVSLLSQARRACDRLIVGLNSDSSVTRLKGKDRPVQAEAARATVLASLASVDAVVIFTEDTPLALLEALRPDVLVKGADYALDEVVGADLVQSYGGRVVLAELSPGFSTTDTIRKLSGK